MTKRQKQRERGKQAEAKKKVAAKPLIAAVEPKEEVANDNFMAGIRRSDVFDTLMAGGWYNTDGSMCDVSHMGVRDERFYQSC